jgi:hypothetical protein
MKISGFTIVRNGVKLQYPVIQSIKSILPVCDEFIVNVGESEDATLEMIKGIHSPKIKIIQTKWDMSKGPTVLAEQTNIALEHCSGDWAVYLQTDEVVHEADLPKMKHCMELCLHKPQVDALQFGWFHFYGSHWRYRIDAGWYQKQVRIIRNNGEIESVGDAYTFGRKDGGDLRVFRTGCYIYHYGWVFSEDIMAKRRLNQGEIWSESRDAEKNTGRYEFGDLNRFPVYFGSHPAVMTGLVSSHPISQKDWKDISRRNWWNPFKWLRIRCKTGLRVRKKII